MVRDTLGPPETILFKSRNQDEDRRLKALRGFSSFTNSLLLPLRSSALQAGLSLLTRSLFCQSDPVSVARQFEFGF